MTTNDQAQAAKKLVKDIKVLCSRASKPLKFMEVCGTHTMAIHESGLKSLLSPEVTLVSGPGCPVCVTEKRFIDHAVLIGKKFDACLVTFGDLIRVPGTFGSLSDFRSQGGLVKIIYSPMDCIDIVSKESPRPVVFLGVGFETTSPTIAATVKTASIKGLTNFFVLPAFKTIHPPLKILASKPDLSGFLLPGHVSAIIGSDCYQYLADTFNKPGVVAGFEALDILIAIRDLVGMASADEARIINDYKRVVRGSGNLAAQALTDEVFEPCDASWRGLGVIPGSGLSFREPYRSFDASRNLLVDVPDAKDDPRCRCSNILTGSLQPDRCGLFGRECTPEQPVGPCMVSSEGTCAAYYKYGTVN